MFRQRCIDYKAFRFRMNEPINRLYQTTASHQAAIKDEFLSGKGIKLSAFHYRDKSIVFKKPIDKYLSCNYFSCIGLKDQLELPYRVAMPKIKFCLSVLAYPKQINYGLCDSKPRSDSPRLFCVLQLLARRCTHYGKLTASIEQHLRFVRGVMQKICQPTRGLEQKV